MKNINLLISKQTEEQKMISGFINVLKNSI